MCAGRGRVFRHKSPRVHPGRLLQQVHTLNSPKRTLARPHAARTTPTPPHLACETAATRPGLAGQRHGRTRPHGRGRHAGAFVRPPEGGSLPSDDDAERTFFRCRLHGVDNVCTASPSGEPTHDNHLCVKQNGNGASSTDADVVPQMFAYGGSGYGTDFIRRGLDWHRTTSVFDWQAGIDDSTWYTAVPQ